MRLLQRLITAAIWLAMVIPPDAPTMAADDVPLDLAAMPLTVNEVSDILGAAGRKEVYGFGTASFVSTESIAVEYAWTLGTTGEELAPKLEDLGLIRTYRFVVGWVSQSDLSRFKHKLVMTVSEYPDADAVADAIDLLHEEVSDEANTFADLEAGDDLGDLADLTEMSGPSFDALNLTVGVDRILVEVFDYDFTLEALPGEEGILEIGEQMIRSVERALRGRTPGLGAAALHIAPPEGFFEISATEWYFQLEGDPQFGFRDDAASRAALPTYLGEETSLYRIYRSWATSPDATGGNAVMYLDLWRFDTPSEAASHLDVVRQYVMDPENDDEVKPVRELGDAMTAIRGEGNYQVIVAQDEYLVRAIIYVGDGFSYSRAAVTDLADMQLACLADGTCAGIADAPAGLVTID